jgi:hypothetical protein
MVCSTGSNLVVGNVILITFESFGSETFSGPTWELTQGSAMDDALTTVAERTSRDFDEGCERG